MPKTFAWLGGAVFAGSLALCAWFYFVTLGLDRPPTGGKAVAADAALLAVFALHHSIFARAAVKRRLSKISAHLERSVYVWSASLLLAGVCLLWRPIGGELYRLQGPAALGFAAIQIAGLLLIARASTDLDPLVLAGIRQASDAQLPVPSLQIAGPYSLVRHPVYLGWMLLFLGTAHMTGDRLAFAGMTSVYLVIAVPLEERSLLQSFGRDYATYQCRVRWRIVPFVY